MRPTRAIAMAVAATAAVTVPAVTAHAAQADPAARPRVQVVAQGLNAPKHLTYAHHGLYFVESGAGGPAGSTNCVAGPVTGGRGQTQYCVGTTGAVKVLAHGRVRVVLGNLPSAIEADNQEVSGPAAVAVTGKGLAVVFQDILVNKDGRTTLPKPAAGAFGTLRLPGGRSVDLARFASEHPQDPASLGGLGSTTYDSDPYDVVAFRDGFAVADAAANDVLYVNRHGQVSVLARFPTVAETVPAGVLGPNPVTVQAQAVPTSLAVGPDGALYVGLLRGVPSLPGTAQIYRVVPGKTPTVWATGLTAVTDIAFDRRGRLLVTELSTAGLLAPPSVPGALVRVSADGKTVTPLPVTGLFHPTGVAVGDDGEVYVANNGTSTAASKSPGAILRITGLR